MTTGPHVVDVTDSTFGTAVLEESHRRPVVVDFWAEWCQPCRMIGPVLERLAGEFAGRFLLAKLDVDANPQIASTFQIRSIPAVKAFAGGRLVNEFVGVIPEQSIREFIRPLVPSPGDQLAFRALDAEAAGRLDEAERLFRQVLENEPNHVEASIGLGRLAAVRGNVDDARRLLEPLRPHPEAERILAALEISSWAAASSNGDDPVSRAERAAAEGRFAEALAGFLGEVTDGGDRRDAAREAMLKLFAVLGDQDPLTREFRRKLAAALF
jgi:putative thioredoxin